MTVCARWLCSGVPVTAATAETEASADTSTNVPSKILLWSSAEVMVLTVDVKNCYSKPLLHETAQVEW